MPSDFVDALTLNALKEAHQTSSSLWKECIGNCGAIFSAYIIHIF
jgi:hypothetical protein